MRPRPGPTTPSRRNPQRLLCLRGVSFGYEAQRPVLTDLDLELWPHQRLAILGANGSGKTTLLHLMVGLVRPDAGTVESRGAVCRREADFHPVRRRVGLLFQNPDDQLFCPTVAEDVAFGPLNLGKSRDEAAETVRETLAMLGLGGFEDRVTTRLSPGEKRRVALATVLAMKPEVLLLDEPTAGLDLANQTFLEDLLKRLPQAMVLVSHDDGFITRVGVHRVLHLSHGRLHEAGSEEALELDVPRGEPPGPPPQDRGRDPRRRCFSPSASPRP